MRKERNKDDPSERTKEMLVEDWWKVEMMSPFGLVGSEVFEGHPNESVEKGVGLTCPKQEARAGI